MTKSDKIGHLAIMSRSNIDHTVSSHRTENFGYLCQLEKIAKDGGFITDMTEEYIGMTNSATDLIRLAKDILLLRNQLLANNKPYLKAVS